MVQSTLTRRNVPHHNKLSSRGGRAVTRVIQHHWAGLSGGDARLMNPSEKVSANYIIYSDGTIACQVPEEYRAWTSGSFAADGGSITFEVQNSTKAAPGKGDNDPESWKVSRAAEQAIIKLLADIARRYNWGTIADVNYDGHREFASTACPGGYLWSRREHIRAEANKILKGTSVPTPATPPTSNKSVHQLADEVLDGLHGNGDARKASLGAMYEAVQTEVNRRLGNPGQKPGTKPPAKPAKKTIAQLADEVLAGAHGTGDARKRSLGSRYNEVQTEVNRRLGMGKSSRGPNISALADAVMRGQYGTGHYRKLKLGANYEAVQAEVNRRIYGR